MFQLGDDLHGADLGGTRDGPRGEAGAEGVVAEEFLEHLRQVERAPRTRAITNAELLEVEVDCAHLLERDGRLTGDLLSPPPAGEARATLLEEYARRSGCRLEESFAYADAISDLPMLEVVGTPVVVNPDARLSQVADQRGWRVESWRMAPGNWRLPVPDPRSPEYREGVRT